MQSCIATLAYCQNCGVGFKNGVIRVCVGCETQISEISRVQIELLENAIKNMRRVK